jgi:3D (Asp-Asp-Asp) domain-containing protein
MKKEKERGMKVIIPKFNFRKLKKEEKKVKVRVPLLQTINTKRLFLSFSFALFLLTTFLVIGYEVKYQHGMTEAKVALATQSEGIKKDVANLVTTVETAKKETIKVNEESKYLQEEKNSLEEEVTSLKMEKQTLEKKVAELSSAKLVKPVEVTPLATSVKVSKANPVRMLSLSSAFKTDTVMSVKATAYTAFCKGCSGVTASGIDVRKETPKLIAVDPKIIPLGSKVELLVSGKSWGIYSAEDVGGDIKGNRIDILMENKTKADNFGIRQIEVKVLKPSY